jgi:mannose-6-phosphate isomerase
MNTATEATLYPLRFEPLLQYRLWGGRRLADWVGGTLPGDGPIGEAWLLSDRADHPSRVADGPLEGQTLAQLIARSPAAMLGRLAGRFQRFPLLLKFLDVQQMLSVQVHPRDDQTALIPAGDTGKTEAWVVLEASAHARIYAGLKPGTTERDLRSLTAGTADQHLASFAPHRWLSVLIEAGTVHSVGDGLVVFEVQENSDATFRLYDWDHVDGTTGKTRPLQLEQGLACVDYTRGPVHPVPPIIESTQPALREHLLRCAHFEVWRLSGTAPFAVGADRTPRVLVCIEGGGHVEHAGRDVAMEKGTVLLLPAALGVCHLRPTGSVVLLELGVPEPS